jgi:SAM-dependent methyltransferase
MDKREQYYNWYTDLAKRNGGYKKNADYAACGLYGETVFEERLRVLLQDAENVLDAGCGSGEFTLDMAKIANRIIGFDCVDALLEIAEHNRLLEKMDNVQFIKLLSGDLLENNKCPFADEQFDIIYSRRGPDNIVNHPNWLKYGGLILGIHTKHINIEDHCMRLKCNGFVNIEYEEYPDAYLTFPTRKDFAEFITASPLNPDYTLAENQTALDERISNHTIDGELRFPQLRYIWSARRL